MTMWCCITPQRISKTSPIMSALAAGWPGGRTCIGTPPDWDQPFIAWGQVWLAEDLIRVALKTGRKFFQIDNGFHKPARGGLVGYYRFMHCQPDPIFLESRSLRQRRMLSAELRADLKPWRKSGRHVLLAMPGPDFGRAFGVDVPAWSAGILKRLQSKTDRPIKIRDRFSHGPLEEDLRDCWAMVTHSSNVAVESVIEGVPAFVEPTSMAAPLGNLSLDELEKPRMGGRRDWWASLMCQQFSIDEMRSGVAHLYLSAVAAQQGARAAA